MLAELVASVICIFVFGDNLWLVVAIVSLNVSLFSLMYLLWFRKYYEVVRRKDLKVLFDDSEVLMEKALAITKTNLEIQGILTFSFMPISVMSMITKTPEKDLLLWAEHDILPHIGPKEYPLVSGIFVASLLRDDDGNVHFSDDFHKPLTAADVMHAVELKKQKESDHA